MEKPKKVMLIDDNHPTNFIHTKIITKVKPTTEILVHDKAEEALNHLKSTEVLPEIIFLDINMPGMDGWEFLEEYEKMTDFKEKCIIIVMLTTSLNPEDVKKSEKYISINGFEHKPLTPEKLQKMFAKYFNQSDSLRKNT
ncbi:response regulator [Polaribacter sp. Asnod6-C07]|uniref:response regulator n=1 Tax=Polaribacter sp. Asnod6-C07 TaxID=3160582 RepID=UPI00386D6286